MSKVCNISPEKSICSACLEIQQMFDLFESCNTCELKKREYELLNVGSGFWSGNYAIVLYKGMVQKVALYRVCNVREKRMWIQ